MGKVFFYWVCLLMCSWQASAIRTYSFEEHTNDEALSFLTLASGPLVQLPDQFIFCTSHQQTKIDNRGFYHIYGEDGAPWMTTKFSLGAGISTSVGLWGNFGKHWVYFGEVEELKLYYWYHLCHQVDTATGILSISINGKMLKSNVTVKSLKQNKPEYLNNKLVIGKSTRVMKTDDDKDEQFSGSVTNFKVFGEQNLSLKQLSENACEQEGDLLAWSDSSWKQTGQGIIEKDKDTSKLCDNKGTYTLPLPLRLSQQQAANTCDKLGHGRMRTTSSMEQLQELVELFQTELPGVCRNIWTPYSDQAEEGVFLSIEDNSKPTFLPWAPDQPNGAESENGIDIRLDKSGEVYYYDRHISPNLDQFICSVCSLDASFSIQLRGVCEFTFMGEFINVNKSLTMKNLFHFLDTYYVIKNAKESIAYKGLRYSSIR